MLISYNKFNCFDYWNSIISRSKKVWILEFQKLQLNTEMNVNNLKAGLFELNSIKFRIRSG